MFKSTNLLAVRIATCLGFFVVQLDVSVVNVGLKALKGAFDTDLTGLQWVINSYSLAFSALLILGGGLGDKWGARRLFVTGFAIFTLGSICCGLSSNMTMLITMRCVQGVGAAFLIPTSLTLLRTNFVDPDQRRSAVALWGACGGMALAAGPVIGGLMIQHFGWRSVFLINVPIGLVALLLTLRYTPVSTQTEKQLDTYGQVSIAIALALLTYGLTEASGEGWTAGPLWSLALAAAAIAVFAVVERRVAEPMLPPRLARNSMLIATMLTGAVINLTFYGVVFVLSIYFQTIRNYGPLNTGLAFIPLTAVMSASSLISAHIGRRISASAIMVTGLSLQIVGFMLLSRIDPDSPLWMLDTAMIVVGVGSASTVPSMNHSMLASVSQNDAGIASGLMSSARQVGGVVGVAVFGMLIAHADAASFMRGMSRAMLVCVASLVLCIAANIFLAHSASVARHA
jgi:DHA2 family methylenomycin A resistance protein-like MFS transporter